MRATKIGNEVDLIDNRPSKKDSSEVKHLLDLLTKEQLRTRDFLNLLKDRLKFVSMDSAEIAEDNTKSATLPVSCDLSNSINNHIREMGIINNIIDNIINSLVI